LLASLALGIPECLQQRRRLRDNREHSAPTGIRCERQLDISDASIHDTSTDDMMRQDSERSGG